MIKKTQTKSNPTRALLVIHPDGHIQLFAERGTIDVQVIHMPDVGRSVEAERLSEAWLETQLRRAHQSIFWPSNIRASGHVRFCTRPTRRLQTAQTLRAIRALSDLESCISSRRESGGMA